MFGYLHDTALAAFSDEKYARSFCKLLVVLANNLVWKATQSFYDALKVGVLPSMSVRDLCVEALSNGALFACESCSSRDALNVEVSIPILPGRLVKV